MTDAGLRQYMRLAEKVQAGTATSLEKLALGFLHLKLKISREQWLKGLQE